MNLLKRSGPVALIISVVALVMALVGTAFSGGSAVPGKNGVKSSDIAKGAVKGSKIAAGAVTGGKFFLGKKVTLNLDVVPGSTCTEFDISAPGVTATDSVVVTPPPTWADTFTLVARPALSTPNAVTVSICNVFTGGGAGDPDGAGGSYKLLVIR